MQRVTYNLLSDNARYYLGRSLNRIAELQEHLATGKRVNRPSDDPTATTKVLRIDRQQRATDRHIANASRARELSDRAASAVQGTVTALQRVRELVLEGADAATSDAARDVLAVEVNEILEQVVSLANTEYAGVHLFGGTAVDTAPFAVERDGDDIASVTYTGASDVARVAIGSGVWADLTARGDRTFQQRDRRDTAFAGNTGAAPGAGTDSATGQATLTVAHTATTYAGGSGVAAGTGSAAGDTIVGAAGTHTLTVVDTSGTGASGTVRLDDGHEVAFTSADTNLAVENAVGDVVYVDTTAITAGFSGTVDITATGTLSVDGGASSTAIGFSASDAVTDAGTGAVTFVDSTGITRIGAERVTYSGTFDVFQALVAIRDELRNVDALPQSEQSGNLSGFLTALDYVEAVIGNSLGAFGNQSVAATNAETRGQDLELVLAELRSDAEDIDISEAVVELQAAQDIMQLTVAASMKLIQPIVLDYI